MDFTLIPTRHAAVTKSDTTNIGNTIGLYVGGAGDVTAIDAHGNSAVYVCVAGAVLPGVFTKVMSTGTTASSIVALYAQ